MSIMTATRPRQWLIAALGLASGMAAALLAPRRLEKASSQRGLPARDIAVTPSPFVQRPTRSLHG